MNTTYTETFADSAALEGGAGGGIFARVSAEPAAGLSAGPEAEARTLQQLIEAAVRQSGGAAQSATGGARDITVVLELDRQQLARAVYRLNDEEDRRVGARLAGGEW